jgi:hypothetical protein
LVNAFGTGGGGGIHVASPVCVEASGLVSEGRVSSSCQSSSSLAAAWASAQVMAPAMLNSIGHRMGLPEKGQLMQWAGWGQGSAAGVGGTGG